MKNNNEDKSGSGIIMWIITAAILLYFLMAFSLAGAIVRVDVDTVTLEPVSIQKEAE